MNTFNRGYDMNIFNTANTRSHKSFRTCALITSYGNSTVLGNNPAFPINCSAVISILLPVTVLRLELHLEETCNCELT